MSTLAELSTAITRSLLGLPPRRCRVRQESSWVATEDGVRLATRRLSPIQGDSAPAVLIRTPSGTGSELGRSMLLGRIIAEAGYNAVVQDVRGRWDSEGIFIPFANEARDGAATLAWISQQPWCAEGIGLVGASYSGHAAWAALSGAPERVRALVVVMASADLHPVFHPGGAFSLASALDWATLVGDHENTPKAHIDLERGLRHRPVREADRVALRRIDWYRDWVDHPHRDAHWEGLAAPLPGQPIPSLLIAGWYDFFLGPQLRDHAAIAERAGNGPRLVIGPWSHGRAAHPRWRGLKRGFLGVSLSETLAFLDLHLRVRPEDAERELGARGSEAAPVRFFMGGADEWRSSSTWPPPESRSRPLYLRAAQTSTQASDGALSWDPPDQQADPGCFEADGEDPLPSVGGAFFSSALWGRSNGARDQRCLDHRDDRLRFTGEALESDLEIAGSVELVLHALSDPEDADFTAKLVDLAPDGSALNLCEGIVRCHGRNPSEAATGPLQSGPLASRTLEIDLWACAWRFRRGHRIRLEVASSSFPRFDRNPGSGAPPSVGDRASAPPSDCPAANPPTANHPTTTRYRLFHDLERPSRLLLPVIDAGTALPRASDTHEGPARITPGGP